MHILILNWRDPKNPKAGGAETATLEHARYWQKAGHQVTWLSSVFDRAGEEIIDSIKIVRKGRGLFNHLFAPFFYLFSGNKFDLVIDEIHGIPYFTPFFVRVPKLVFVHEVASEIWDYMYYYPVNKIGRLIEPFLYFFYRNTTIMTVSPSTKKDLVTLGLPTKNIHVIFNGLSQKATPNLNGKKLPNFIFISRLVKMKGVEDVLKAFSIIKKSIKNARFWIVGTGDKDYVEKLKRQNKNVRFFDYVSEEKKFVLLKKSYLILHASVKEGWGLVIIEAASQGTPAIVYNVGGLRDSVKNNLTGIIIRKNNPEELADEATKLFKDQKKYNQLQKNCLKWAANFSWEKSGKESLKLIESLTS